MQCITPEKPCFSALLGEPQAPYWGHPKPRVDEAAPRAPKEMEVPTMAFWKPKKTAEPGTAVDQPAQIPTPAPAIVTPEAQQQPAELVPGKKKKRRGKPQDMSRLTRNKVVQIRMTEQEVAELKEAAAAANMTLADFVMAGIHQSRRIVIPGALEIRKELFREGRNLNQAVRLANAAKREGRPADLQSIQAAAAKVQDNLDRLAELLIKWDVDLTEETRKEGS